MMKRIAEIPPENKEIASSTNKILARIIVNIRAQFFPLTNAPAIAKCIIPNTTEKIKLKAPSASINPPNIPPKLETNNVDHTAEIIQYNPTMAYTTDKIRIPVGFSTSISYQTLN